jgi:sigma-E factor negative regulatory protein RseA
MQGVENISTLMDGELDGDEAGRAIARLKADSLSRETWDTYHLIGDAMRGATGSTGAAAVVAAVGASGAPGFGLRFSERLAQEPTVLAPHTSVSSTPQRFLGKFQTYALSAAASVAAVAVVGWVALSTLKPEAPVLANASVAPVAQPQVAALQPGVAVPQVQPIVGQAPAAMLAAAQVEPVQEYLLAHQGISPTTAIQGVTPYIRTVSSTGE